eukprot:5822340-Prymnesium_polylepis.1
MRAAFLRSFARGDGSSLCRACTLLLSSATMCCETSRGGAAGQSGPRAAMPHGTLPCPKQPLEVTLAVRCLWLQ